MNEHNSKDWDACRFLTCSVLPVRVACNLDCPFCFSKSSISALRQDRAQWRSMDLARYYRFARARGARRLVITGGGEPLLRPDDVLHMVEVGREFFDEIACFTNGTYLTPELSRCLSEAGLSYLCWSRHATSNADNRALMGEGAPDAESFVEAAGSLRIRATCVMAKGWIERPEEIWRYIEAMSALGIVEFTFKHTYVAYGQSVFGGSEQDSWAAKHQVEYDPFVGVGRVVAELPWGPQIRAVTPAREKIADIQQELKICYYREPTPEWERTHRIARSCNLLSNGSVYASLEDQRSLLFQLPRSSKPSTEKTSSPSDR